MGAIERFQQLLTPPATYVRGYRCDDCGKTTEPEGDCCPHCEGELDVIVGTIPNSYWELYH